MFDLSLSPRLGISDPDSGFVTEISEACGRAGWQLERIANGAPDLQALAAAKLTALVLDPADWRDPSWDRLALLCGAIPRLSVSVCSTSSSVSERVRGLRLGLDAWIAKPCEPEEVLARLEAAARWERPLAEVADLPLRSGELELRPAWRQALIGGEPIRLSPKQFDVVYLFASESGRVLEREEIYRRVWGYAMPWGDRSVDVYVLKLRNLLRRHSPGWEYIHTYFRLGYRFEAEPTLASAARSPKPTEPIEVASA